MKYIVYILLLTLFNQHLRAQDKIVDSIKRVIKTAKNDTVIVNAWKAWDNLIYLSDPEMDLELNTKINTLSKKRLKRQLNKKEKTFFLNANGYALNCLGLISQNHGDFPQALKYFFASLKIRKQIGNKLGCAAVYNNIGSVYEWQGNYSEALKIHFDALKIFKEIGNPATIASSYSNIGIVYKRLRRYDEALENYAAALKIQTVIRDKYGMALTYSGIGHVHTAQSNYPEALKNHFVSLKLEEELGDKRGIAISYWHIGNVYTKTGKAKKGRSWQEKSLSLSMEIGNKELIKWSYFGLADADSAIGNHKTSLENYKMYIIYRDSLINEENTKKTVQTQMQYEFGKQQATDSIKNAEHTKQQTLKHNQEIKQQKVYTYGGIIGFGLMLIVAFVSFRAFRNKQKANHIIAEQKHLVEEKQKEIIDSIRYAKRIQIALLPSEKYIERKLSHK